MHSPLPAIVVVLPLFGAVLAVLLGRLWRFGAWAVAALALGASAVAAIALLVELPSVEGGVLYHRMGMWIAPKGIDLRVDALNGIVVAMIAAVAFLTVLWGPASVRREIRPAGHASWYAIVLLFVAGLFGIAITGDIFNLYVFLEIASITSYVMVAMGRRRQGLYAGFTYLILGSIGATFVLIGIGHLYMVTGALGMEDVYARLHAAGEGGRSLAELHPSVVHTAFAFITIGLAIKMALFPLHSWQPGAYTHAPSMGSLLLAATATKVAAYAYYRFAFTVFGPDYLEGVLRAMVEGVLVLAAAAMVIGPLLALRQTNFKRMLAFSSVGQIGYVVLGAVLLTDEGGFSQTAMTGSILHFWNHAAAKGALFAVAGIVAFRAGTTHIDDLRGLGRRAPWTAAAMTVAALSLVGVPLTGGFLSKYYLVLGCVETGRWVLLFVILVSSLLTLGYMWACLQRVWFLKRGDPVRVERDVPWSMRAPTLALAAACLVLGIAASVPVGLAAAAAKLLAP